MENLLRPLVEIYRTGKVHNEKAHGQAWTIKLGETADRIKELIING